MIASYWKNRKLRRRLKDLKSSVAYLLKADDDILSEKQKSALVSLREELGGINKSAVSGHVADLDSIETKLSVAVPRTGFFFTMRGFLDVLAVAVSVAFGIRALYLQPFKIPTSSMQPTLYGIHYIDKKESAPHTAALTKLFMPLGASRAEATAGTGGIFSTSYQPYSSFSVSHVLRNILHPGDLYFSGSAFTIGRELHTVPGSLDSAILRYLDFDPSGETIRKGETVFDGWVSSGDHLFVDRFSIHFRPLKRGDVIVFNTENIVSPTQPMGGYYYIKRLVALPGDTLKIENDVLMIRPEGENEFRPASDFSDKFKKLYSFKGGYQGHKASGNLAPGMMLTVPADSYFALGDNTSHSLDGRNWGVVPRQNIVGYALNIFWPVSRRWGLVDRMDALDVPTRSASSPYQQVPEMRLQ